jgi:hypothetical protein
VVPDGQIAAGANNFGCCGVYSNFYALPFSPTNLNVTYGGAAPGLVAGVVQINFQAAASGQVVLTVGSPYSRLLLASDPVWIFVKP